MNARRLSIMSLFAAATLPISTAAVAADDVRASFHRMLSHQPTPVSAPAGVDVGSDPLLSAIVIPLRDGTKPRVAAVDPVAASFSRMLAHSPSAHTPPVPGGSEADPLVAAVVEPVRVWLSEAAAARYHVASSDRPVQR